MSNARKFVDLAFDLIVLIVGLAILFKGMRTIGVMQDAELERALNGGGKITYISENAEQCSGGQVIAYLLGHDSVDVVINGVVYASDSRSSAIENIDCSATYSITRTYVVNEYGAPDALEIVKD